MTTGTTNRAETLEAALRDLSCPVDHYNNERLPRLMRDMAELFVVEATEPVAREARAVILLAAARMEALAARAVADLRSEIFAVLRRHDVSEQCFAEVAMVTQAKMSAPPERRDDSNATLSGQGI